MVVSRTLREFDVLYAAHYPQETGLLEQVPKQGLKVHLQLPTSGPVLEVSTTAQERAQHLKILRVLRFMVLPEMVKRLMGD